MGVCVCVCASEQEIVRGEREKGRRELEKIKNDLLLQVIQTTFLCFPHNFQTEEFHYIDNIIKHNNKT